MDRSRLRGLLLGTLQDEHAPPGEVQLRFVGDRTMRRINRDHRGVDGTTDVLSFSYVDAPHNGGTLGEIFVSPRVAAAQARDEGCPLPEEIARLAVHGMLHVLGYDHDTSAARREMFARQEKHLEAHFARVGVK